MTSSEFWNRMVDLKEEGKWVELEQLLQRDHPLLPGEREVFLVLVCHEINLGHHLIVQLDVSGMHVIKK